MVHLILGLDIGGANLKAATADGRAVSVPFALWKTPAGLPAALAALVQQFPGATAFAVTMTGELCDCFETKRQGVAAILDAVAAAAAGRPVKVWTTDGTFVDVAAARTDPLKAAAANWLALATFAGRFAPAGGGLLLDVGSTTTDIVPLRDGKPAPAGRTDTERMHFGELVYTGVRRTPVCAVLGIAVAAELFATTLDAYLLLGMAVENPADTDTADGRPATVPFAHARMARMLGGDVETVSLDDARELAERVMAAQMVAIEDVTAGVAPGLKEGVVVTSGSGEALAKAVVASAFDGVTHVSLTAKLGATVSACGPAYALAVLAAEAGAFR